MVGFDLFALVGIWAAANDPLASLWVAVLACVAGALVGTATTLLLDRWWRSRATEAEAAGPAGRSGRARRTVLINAGVLTGVLLVLTAAARSARTPCAPPPAAPPGPCRCPGACRHPRRHPRSRVPMPSRASRPT